MIFVSFVVSFTETTMRTFFLLTTVVLAAVALPHTQSVPRQDGASETWQKLLKLRTTASVMHVTAHPDDEHGGVLAKLSRGDGARMALLTLNRGESGDNAIGPQLFDGLGLIRTEELLHRQPPLRRRRAVLHDGGRLRLLEDGSRRRSTSGAAKPCCATWSASSA